MRLHTLVLFALLLSSPTQASSPLIDADAADLPKLAVELVADGLTAPIDLVSPADGSGRRFVVDQTGLVHILSADGNPLPTPFLDLREKIVPLVQGFDERGLLGFAFHPRYAENGRFYVSYSAPLRPTAPPGWNYTRRISEFTVSAADANMADPTSERVHALFVTAVGETLWESVYLVDQPGNYGWAIREATHCFDRYQPKEPPTTCQTVGAQGEPLIDPIIEYPNMSIGQDGVKLDQDGVGTAVVGGHIYRGAAIENLQGKYVFGDWSHDFMKPSGQIFVATPPAEWARCGAWQRFSKFPAGC